MDRKLRKKQLAVKMANNQLKILSVFDKKSLIAARILTGDYSLEIDDWGFLIASSETIIKLSNYLKKILTSNINTRVTQLNVYLVILLYPVR